MGNRKLIASAVGDSRLGVFDSIISDQFDSIDLAPVMVYLTDCVDATALPWLAKQLDVDGWKGFDQCQTEQQQRELIKNAINLHRFIGTLWGIRKACTLIGFTPTAIEENVPILPGGDNVWCAFRIRLTPEDLGIINANSLTMLKTFISYYKPARSILNEIYFGVEMSDSLSMSDSLVLSGGDYNNDFNDDFNT